MKDFSVLHDVEGLTAFASTKYNNIEDFSNDIKSLLDKFNEKKVPELNAPELANIDLKDEDAVKSVVECLCYDSIMGTTARIKGSYSYKKLKVLFTNLPFGMLDETFILKGRPYSNNKGFTGIICQIDKAQDEKDLIHHALRKLGDYTIVSTNVEEMFDGMVIMFLTDIPFETYRKLMQK